MAFYEDSEGDFNVLSEDEDLASASAYMQEHNSDTLECSIVDRQFFNDVLRSEQTQSELNQSTTWQRSTLNNFVKGGEKHEHKVLDMSQLSSFDGMAASMMSKVEELIAARV